MCEYQQITNSPLALCKGGGLCTMCVLGNQDKYKKIYEPEHPISNSIKKGISK